MKYFKNIKVFFLHFDSNSKENVKTLNGNVEVFVSSGSRGAAEGAMPPPAL